MDSRSEVPSYLGERTAAIITLGCPKNFVDSEVIAHQVVSAGYRIVPNPEEAHLIVVNTCGFLESAVQEAVNMTLQMGRLKQEGSCSMLVVVGCMVQRYGKKLLPLLPEVDIFVGTSHYHCLRQILEASRHEKSKLWIQRPGSRESLHARRLRCGGGPSAYVKIAEGCNHGCTFCLIPKLRGPYRSRRPEDVVAEVRSLAQAGVLEINLVAQDTTFFGFDLGIRNGLSLLLESLAQVEGIRWIRILYAYPERVGSALLDALSHLPKVVPYLDIPFQHASPRILKAMGRSERPSPYDLVEAIRDRIPHVSLRTTLMVGFPGEQQRDFDECCRFVEWARFDHVGVFAFSPEPGCRAARLPDPVKAKTASARMATLMEIQRSISREKLSELKGRTVPLLVEGVHPESELLGMGRLASQAPEVDGHVIITEGKSQSGIIAMGRILRTHDYDVEASIL